MRKKLLDSAAVIASSLGALGLVVTAIGAGALILGLSGKVVNRLAETIKPHELTIEKMVFYGGNAGIAGLSIASCGAAIAWFVGDKSDCFSVPNESIHHCNGCIYYSANSYLPCAVHPNLLENCVDYASNQDGE